MDIQRLKQIAQSDAWHLRNELNKYITELEKEQKGKPVRTGSQNNSIHLYLSKISEQLQDEGHTMQDVVMAIKRAEIIPTMLALKEVVWKPIQKIMFGVDSTTQLKKIGQIDKVYMAVDKFFADNFGATYPFPVDENKQAEKLANPEPSEEAINNYPENNYEPKF